MRKEKYQDLSRFSVPKGFRGRGVILVQIWWLTQSLIFRTSPQMMYGWRRFLLRLFGAEIGKNVIIRPSAKITYPWKLKIGDYSWIGDNVELYTLGPITIGANAVVSQNCYLCTGSHEYRSQQFDIYSEPIVIEDEVWLASDVFVHPGVTVGRGAVIGARSTVASDIQSGMVAVGFPAKPVRQRLVK